MRQRTVGTLLLLLLWAGPAAAQQLEISVQVPQLDVAEYHRPYVAAWIEDGDRRVVANLLLWYQQDRPGAPPNAERGSKWLPDLRQWWRRSGRGLSLPVDGVSSATRPVGEHAARFDPGRGVVPALAPGDYQLRVEAAREEGGRELVEIGFAWPPAAIRTLTAAGTRELGMVRLILEP